MAGPNFSVQPNQEFEFDNEAQIQRWLAVGYVEVVGIPGGGRRLENAGARTARTDAPGDATPAAGTSEQASTADGTPKTEDAKPAAEGGSAKDDSPKSKPAAKPSGKGKSKK